MVEGASQSHLSFFVKIDGSCHSSHRSPQGIYHVAVMEERTLLHTACAALSVARESVPFFDENQNSVTLRAFLEDGREIIVPRPLACSHVERARYLGRATSCPEVICVQ